MIGKFLLWLQERIKHWIKPATPVLVSGVLSDITRSRADLEPKPDRAKVGFCHFLGLVSKHF